MIEQTIMTDPRVQSMRQALAAHYIDRYGAHDLDADREGDYLPPVGGASFIALDAGSPVGIGSYRRHDDTTCEVRRFYVTPHARRRRRALDLWQAVTGHAEAAGYHYAIGTTEAPATLSQISHQLTGPYNAEGRTLGVTTFRAPLDRSSHDRPEKGRTL